MEEWCEKIRGYVGMGREDVNAMARDGAGSVA